MVGAEPPLGALDHCGAHESPRLRWRCISSSQHNRAGSLQLGYMAYMFHLRFDRSTYSYVMMSCLHSQDLRPSFRGRGQGNKQAVCCWGGIFMCSLAPPLAFTRQDLTNADCVGLHARFACVQLGPASALRPERDEHPSSRMMTQRFQGVGSAACELQGPSSKSVCVRPLDAPSKVHRVDSLRLQVVSTLRAADIRISTRSSIHPFRLLPTFPHPVGRSLPPQAPGIGTRSSTCCSPNPIPNH